MRHLTVRPWFVLGLSFAVLLLIPLWAGFGVFGGVGTGEVEGGHQEGGHSTEGMAGMKGKAGMGDPTQEFMAKVQAFMAQNTREDGCVVPSSPADEMGEMGGMKDMEGGQHGEAAPVVYLQALQWAYLPPKLCLESGKTYEFRMMATDVIHGASIQLGDGSKMVRLPPGVEVVQEVTFPEPGEYLLYCSFYCGLGHQFMKGRIIVAAAAAHAGDHAQEGGH